MNSPESSKQNSPKRKKKYSTPVVRSYGVIHAITKNVGKTGMIDGGGKNPRTGLP